MMPSNDDYGNRIGMSHRMNGEWNRRNGPMSHWVVCLCVASASLVSKVDECGTHRTQ